MNFFCDRILDEVVFSDDGGEIITLQNGFGRRMDGCLNLLDDLKLHIDRLPKGADPRIPISHACSFLDESNCFGGAGHAAGVLELMNSEFRVLDDDPILDGKILEGFTLSLDYCMNVYNARYEEICALFPPRENLLRMGDPEYPLHVEVFRKTDQKVWHAFIVICELPGGDMLTYHKRNYDKPFEPMKLSYVIDAIDMDINEFRACSINSPHYLD